MKMKSRTACWSVCDWNIGLLSAQQWFGGLHFIFTNVIYSNQSEIATHHITEHNTPIHNILSTAPQLSICQKALGTLPEDGNVMPKHVGTTINN
jgi:hypothetical protein